MTPLAQMIVQDELTPKREKEIKDGCRDAWNQNRKFFAIYLDDPGLSAIERKILLAIGRRAYERA